MLVSSEATLKIVDEELQSIKGWSHRHNIKLSWIPESLEIRAVLVQKSGQTFFLKGQLENYPILPPGWIFCDSNWSHKKERRLYPKNSKTPFGSSVFHTQPVICAPFNRYAYKSLGGPHADWGDQSNWKNAKGNFVKAYTIADMLSIIYRDFTYSVGRM